MIELDKVDRPHTLTNIPKKYSDDEHWEKICMVSGYTSLLLTIVIVSFIIIVKYYNENK